MSEHLPVSNETCITINSNVYVGNNDDSDDILLNQDLSTVEKENLSRQTWILKLVFIVICSLHAFIALSLYLYTIQYGMPRKFGLVYILYYFIQVLIITFGPRRAKWSIEYYRFIDMLFAMISTTMCIALMLTVSKTPFLVVILLLMVIIPNTMLCWLSRCVIDASLAYLSIRVRK